MVVYRFLMNGKVPMRKTYVKTEERRSSTDQNGIFSLVLPKGVGVELSGAREERSSESIDNAVESRCLQNLHD